MTPAFAWECEWGAHVLPDGQARFGIWAPGQDRLWLYSEASASREPMHRAGDGWFELVSASVPVGTGYAFELAGGRRVPDPAARAQMGDVHGLSRLVGPREYRWRTADWTGRPWHEAVIYELHTGTFSPEGTFAGIEARLDHIAGLGVTTIELMPVAQFGGDRGWGYDGVLLYAPHAAYGGPEGLKRLVDAAHERGLMVLLDVVYNHLGPDGNYLHLYAPAFFDTSRSTPWGPAIDYTQTPVRRFAIDNALYWLEEFRFDGLRLDAIDFIQDASDPPLVEELAATVRARLPGRHIHLTTEDNRNITRLHERGEGGEPTLYTAEWNDDWHHGAHVLATGETDGYYADHRPGTARRFARVLASGYGYQGEASAYFGHARGEPSGHLPPDAFIDFLQNHDQIGNRAFGARLTTLASADAVEALTAILLLSPHIPLLFMGEEWAETRPFLFFADFTDDLARNVREGRRHEFADWHGFADPAARAAIPDPNARATFEASRLDWAALERESGKARLSLVTNLLKLRQTELMPRFTGMGGYSAIRELSEGTAIQVAWRLGDGSAFTLTANLGAQPADIPPAALGPQKADTVVFERPPGAARAAEGGRLEPWSAVFTIAGPGRGQE